MKTIFKICISIIFLTSIYSCNTEQENKVLIIGIDGSRPDAILTANTPIIDSLWKNGAYSFKEGIVPNEKVKEFFEKK